MESLVINGVEYIRKDDISAVKSLATPNDEGLRFVCVRTYSAGVHIGYLKEHEGTEVVLSNTRRIWKWAGAFTLSELALDGVKNPEECKFSKVIPEILLTQAIEIIPVTEDAKASLLSVGAYDYNDK